MKLFITICISLQILLFAGIYIADKQCFEENYSVSEPPIKKQIETEPCSKIVLAPDTIFSILIKNDGMGVTPVSVKFNGNKIETSKLSFRVGSKPESYEVRTTKHRDYAKFAGDLDRPAQVEIVDVPKHLRGGHSSLWYEIKDKTVEAVYVQILRDYPTQILVPRGYDIKIT